MFALRMRSLRSLSAWSLLAITMALLVPREQWHGFGHLEHVATHDAHGPVVSSSCAQCDLGMPAAVASEALAPLVHNLIRCPLPIEAVQGTFLGFTPLAADRGPPSLL